MLSHTQQQKGNKKMSYANFKAKIWSKSIDKALERVCVFAEDTNQKYAGEIKGLGDTVRILGVGKPTITKHTLKNGAITLSGAETVDDTSVSLVVDTAAYFNYKVDDIDKAQGASNVLEVLNTEASEGCANEIDKVIADLAKDKAAHKYSGSNTVITAANVLETLDGCQQALYENDVKPGTEIVVTLPPWMFTIFREKFAVLDTDNSELLKNGKVARYAGMTIKMSNNVAQNASNHYMVQVKTQRAIALAKSEPHVEPYRPENGFADAVKGFVMFGAKIVRPEEMIVLECSPS